ncbi:hypothetical protein D7319_12030 [Streptomyces radicis]|uniref:Hemerythrin-like domain-containing protein n=1 Tax=Streptomyces radicis TaxID=1750517 RepID=A0A3A9WPS6_9ACTN|nr:hypothetical protein D7319_12030 [Streptomyces radicis]RKN23403.1 hypothetical protein D7318_12985 [Streptomyces radicis]
MGAQLRVNCLTFCAGLHHHHTMEDNGMLPGIEAQRPELAPAIEDRLMAELNRHLDHEERKLIPVLDGAA